jgi:hypothetical protein
MEKQENYSNPWKSQTLGETFLLLLCEPFLKNSPSDAKKLREISNSTLYLRLGELEKGGFYFKKNSKTPEEINFYVGVLKAMRKRRVPGVPNPAAVLQVLIFLKFVQQKTLKGTIITAAKKAETLLWLSNVLYRLPPFQIIKTADNFFGNHSLRNVCIVLLLLAQANPVYFEQPIQKRKKINFDRQLKHRGLQLGEPSAQEIFNKHFS